MHDVTKMVYSLIFSEKLKMQKNIQ